MQAKHHYILTVTQANNTILKRFITRYCIPYLPLTLLVFTILPSLYLYYPSLY